MASGPSSIITVAHLLRKIDDLPSLPETVTKTKEALDGPEIEMKQIEALVERDPLVAVKLLKLANSAAYSFSGRIAQISMAMRLLGLQETYNLVLASTVLSMLENAQGLDYKRFWNEALFTASVVPLIAQVADVQPTPALATAGLLHDIGRFALAQVAPERYKKVAPNYSGANLATVEQELLGLSHPEAGYVVADHWDLPAEITTLIRYHHRPDRADTMQTEACIISLATFLAETHLQGGNLSDDADLDDTKYALTHLKISADQLRDTYTEVAQNFHD
ncbi:MAG: HDOD domain-containing protein [Candidatus Hydrogenedentota bacterium]